MNTNARTIDDSLHDWECASCEGIEILEAPKAAVFSTSNSTKQTANRTQKLPHRNPGPVILEAIDLTLDDDEIQIVSPSRPAAAPPSRPVQQDTSALNVLLGSRGRSDYPTPSSSVVRLCSIRDDNSAPGSRQDDPVSARSAPGEENIESRHTASLSNIVTNTRNLSLSAPQKPQTLPVQLTTAYHHDTPDTQGAFSISDPPSFTMRSDTSELEGHATVARAPATTPTLQRPKPNNPVIIRQWSETTTESSLSSDQQDDQTSIAKVSRQSSQSRATMEIEDAITRELTRMDIDQDGEGSQDETGSFVADIGSAAEDYSDPEDLVSETEGEDLGEFAFEEGQSFKVIPSRGITSLAEARELLDRLERAEVEGVEAPQREVYPTLRQFFKSDVAQVRENGPANQERRSRKVIARRNHSAPNDFIFIRKP